MTSLTVITTNDGAEKTGRHPLDDRLAMSGVPGISSRFADDVWDLSAADYIKARKAPVRIDFSLLPEDKPSLKMAAKELAFHRLNTRLSSRLQPISPFTCQDEQVRLRRFIRWLGDFYPGVGTLADVTQRMVHAYRVWLSGNKGDDGRPVSAEAVWTAMSVIAMLDNYRSVLTEPLRERPYNGKLTPKFLGATSEVGENRTPPIPDEVLRPMVSGAIRYLKNYSGDVQAWVDEVAEWRQQNDAKTSFPPALIGPVSVCPERGEAWRKEFSEGRELMLDLRSEIGHAAAACTIIILYLSGMRPTEVAELRVDCLNVSRDQFTGEPYRWKLRGTPLKKGLGRKGRKTVDTVEWTVPSIVADAVECLLRLLAPFRDAAASDLLLVNGDALNGTPRNSRAGYILKTDSIQRLINGFCSMLGERYGEMPDGGRVMPSQFRRTLARYIARQPLGIIAGKLQYHHVSTIMFEGYAGMDVAGLKADVDEERVMANMDLLSELDRDAENGFLVGAAAKRLVREYRTAKEAALARVDGSNMEISVAATLKSVAANLHVGPLNFCVFDPMKAHCLSGESREKGATPRIGMCSPTRCGNAAIGKCHVGRWQELLDEAVALRASAKTTPQKRSLDMQIAEYNTILDTAKEPA